MRINFILNSVNDAHSMKRVNDFKKQGYDVKIFGFLRDATTSKIPNAIILGCFSNKQSYKKRISTYYKGIKCAFKEEKRQDILWYYLGLDVALFALLLSQKKNIYLRRMRFSSHVYQKQSDKENIGKNR